MKKQKQKKKEVYKEKRMPNMKETILAQGAVIKFYTDKAASAKKILAEVKDKLEEMLEGLKSKKKMDRLRLAAELKKLISYYETSLR